MHIPNSRNRIELDIVRMKGRVRKKQVHEIWEVSGDGYFRMISPSRTGWSHPITPKPKYLLEAIEKLFLQTTDSGIPPHWSAHPVLRSAVVKPTASRRSQVEVDDEIR